MIEKFFGSLINLEAEANQLSLNIYCKLTEIKPTFLETQNLLMLLMPIKDKKSLYLTWYEALKNTCAMQLSNQLRMACSFPESMKVE